MKRVVIAFSILALFFAFWACVPEENNSGSSGNGKDNLAPVVTAEANHISAISAVLAGKTNLGAKVASDFRVGFQYSPSELLSYKVTSVEAIDVDANHNYTTAITGLEPDTKYYFRSFVHQNGQDTYGETKEFTTKRIESLLETKGVSSVDANGAILNAKLDLTDVKYSDIEYGFYWDTFDSYQDYFLKGGDIADHAYTAALTSLSGKTEYWYRAFVKLDGHSFYGEVNTFTTAGIPVESVSLDKTEYTFNTIGNTLQLKATVLPANATDTELVWSSDNEEVATVTSYGLITANGNGQAIISVTTKDKSKTATCTISVAQWVKSIWLEKTTLALIVGDEAQIIVRLVHPNNANDKSYSWSSSDSGIATVDSSGKVTAKSEGNTTIKVTANDGSGVFAVCSVIVYNRIVVPQAIDMGTVVDGKNVKWASFNIGASSPEECGIYYAWGETEPKLDYSWSTYTFGSSNRLSKYNTKSSYGTFDNKRILEPEDDVAHVKLGAGWRIPTDAEWTELREKCTWTCIDNYKGTGVNGALVTADNGNSIFLPSTGYRYNTYINPASIYGYYWSSSLNIDLPDHAWSAQFFTYLSDAYSDRERIERYHGYAVRPVSE